MYQRQLTFGEAVKKTLTENYCNFSGRASRSEFWWFQLFLLIVSSVASGLSYAISGNDVLSYIINLIFFLPGLGLSVRRLHDTGKSGWLILPCFVFCIGSRSIKEIIFNIDFIFIISFYLIFLIYTIILIVFYTKESDMFTNEYGDVPYTDNNGNNNQFTPNNVPPQNNNQW